MSNYKAFIDFVDYLIENCKEPVEMSPEIKEIYDLLSTMDNNTKPLLTEAGLQILEYFQGNNTKNLKAKDIADGMEVSPRKVTGAIRKLVADGYVNKFGTTPTIYTLTEKGKNFDIVTYKETYNNEKED